MRNKSIDEMNDNVLKNQLEEDEKILWQSAPEPFRIISEKNKGRLITRWIICVVCFVVVTIAYVQAIKGSGMQFSILLDAILALICLYIALVPVFDARKVMNKCSYYLTDRRAVVVVNAREALSLKRKDINVKLVDADNGSVHVLLGACTGSPEKKYLVSTFVPKMDENAEKAIGIVFYSVKDSEELRLLLNS